MGTQSSLEERYSGRVLDILQGDDPAEIRALRDFALRLRQYLRMKSIGESDLGQMFSARKLDMLTTLNKNPWSPVVKYTPCGKNCNGCPHGPYLYLVRRDGPKQSDQEWFYVGPGASVTEKLPNEIAEQIDEAPIVHPGDDEEDAVGGLEWEGEPDSDTPIEGELSHLNYQYIIETPSGETIGYIDISPFEYRYDGPQAELVRDIVRGTADITVDVGEDGEGPQTVPISEEERAVIVSERLANIEDLEINIVPLADDLSSDEYNSLPADLEQFARVGRIDPWTETGYPSCSDVRRPDATLKEDSNCYPEFDWWAPRRNAVLPEAAADELWQMDFSELGNVVRSCNASIDTMSQPGTSVQAAESDYPEA